MIALVDYGVGNLFSLVSSLSRVGAQARVASDPETVMAADRVILPGVGAFGDAAEKLRKSGLGDAVTEKARAGAPLLGICLGMQLLFDKSLEYGEHRGLGLLPGVVRPIGGLIPPGFKIPHMGWNALTFPGPRHPLFRYIREGEYVYFVHSYAADGVEDSLIAAAWYGAPLTAAAARGNVMGTQFHPEKSGPAGLQILRAFCETEGAA